MFSGNLFNIEIQEQEAALNINLNYKSYESYEDCESDTSYDPSTFDSSNIKFIKFILTIESSSINDLVINGLVDLEHRNFTTTFSITDHIPVVCISICAAKGIIEPLVECFDTDFFTYLGCLKSKGVTIASDIIKCVIDCCVITS